MQNINKKSPQFCKGHSRLTPLLEFFVHVDKVVQVDSIHLDFQEAFNDMQCS